MSLDFQICLDRSDQSRLRFVFGLKCPENLLINGAVRHDMLNDHSFSSLTLPPEPCYGLGIELQGPCEAEPDDCVAAGLEIETVSSRSRVDQGYWDFAVVPSADTVGFVQLGKRDTPIMQPFHDPLQIMLVPIGHQKRLTVCRLDDVLQSIQLLLMNGDRIPGIVVNGTIGHLGELAGEDCGRALRCAAAFTAAADYLGKNCAGGESFTVGDVTVKGMTGQTAQALADGLRQSAERLMAPYAVSGTFCFKGVRG